MERSHSIRYEIEVQHGFDVNANGQIGFAGTDVELGATVARQLGHSYGKEETISRSVTVKAKPGTNMVHRIKQEEVWRMGTAKVVVGDSQLIVPFSFRNDFSVQLVDSNRKDCDAPPDPSVSSQTSPTSTVEPFCAFVTQAQVEELKTFQDVAAAIQKAEEFAGHRQNDYVEGSTIPAGVLIAMDLQSTNLDQFGVVPINNQGGWGLFITTREFEAPDDGTYWCVQETETAVTAQSPTSTTASSTAASTRICGDNEGAFRDGLNTPDPLFWRPEGFVAGWLSSDPATIVLPDGTSTTFDSQFVIVVEDLPWIQVQGVNMANGKALTWGCWYTTEQFVEQDAIQDLCVKKQGGSFGRLYRVSPEGMEELGTTQTVSCP